METNGKRASDRIELELPIEVAGTDCRGLEFLDRTRTLVIARQGGKIRLERELAPQQEVMVRCLTTGREAVARIVGQMGKSSGAYAYGIKLLGEEDNIWGIDFPPLTESDGAIGRVLLECIGCKNREVICLDYFELEVLEANGHLSHSCKRCRDVSLWRKSREDISESEIATPAASPPASSPPVPAKFQDRRSEARRQIRVTACIRTARFGQDLVKIRNVSRGGLCFTSPWEYLPDEAVEVAVPFSPGGGNIFLPAKIVRIQFLASEATRTYGLDFRI